MSFDQADADPVAAHAYLTRSYWAAGVPLETVRKSMAHSLCCTVHDADGQVGMARVITDYATHAYVADVYVLEEHQGKGIAQAILAALKAHPDLQGMRRWMLFTRDAHKLYERFDFVPLAHPERAMLIEFPDVYR